MKSIAIAAAIGFAALSFSAPPANAAGCLKGAILGGIAGHYAGDHPWLGAGAGCFIGRQWANRSARQPQTATGQTLTATRQTQTTMVRSRAGTVVSRDRNGNPIYKDQYGRLIARNQTATPYLVRDQNGNTVTRYRVETTGYGSSTPDRMR